MNGKEYLLSLDIMKLFETYYENFYKEDIIFNGRMDKENISELERKEIVKYGFLKAIDEINNTIPKEDTKYFLLPTTFYDYDLEDDLSYNIYEDVDISLLEISSIKDEGIKEYIKSTEEISLNLLFETYSFMFVSWEEILGCKMLFIPEDEKINYDTAAYLIHEMTWFGYDKETIEKNEKEEKKKLDESIEELKNPENLKTFSMDEMYEEFGIEKPSKEEDELREKLTTEIVIKSYNKKIDIYNKYIVGGNFSDTSR